MRNGPKGSMMKVPLQRFSTISPGCQLHCLASHYVWPLLQVFQRRLWTLPVRAQVTTQAATRSPRGLTGGVCSRRQRAADIQLLVISGARPDHSGGTVLITSLQGSLPSACFAQDTWQCRAHLKHLTTAESYLLCGLHMQSCLVNKHPAACRCRYAAFTQYFLCLLTASSALHCILRRDA